MQAATSGVPHSEYGPAVESTTRVRDASAPSADASSDAHASSGGSHDEHEATAEVSEATALS